jgi:hypothetical protein
MNTLGEVLRKLESQRDEANELLRRAEVWLLELPRGAGVASCLDDIADYFSRHNYRQDEQ